MSDKVLLVGSEMNATIQGHLTANGIDSTIVSGSNLEHTDLTGYTAIWVSWYTIVTDTTGTLAAKLAAFIAAGGNVLVEGGTNLIPFLPSGSDVTQFDSGGNSVAVVDQFGDLLDGLNSADFSSWNYSYHSTFTLSDYDQFKLVAEGSAGADVTLVQNYGDGHVILTGQDASWHLKYGDWHGGSAADGPQLDFILNSLGLDPWSSFMVNFDGPTNAADFNSTYSEDGLTFTSPTHLHFYDDPDGDGKNELMGHNGGTETIEITKTGGGSFSLMEMDTSTSGYTFGNTAVEWIGYRLEGGVYVETGRMVITPGTHVTFTAAFHNVDKVVWNSAYTAGGALVVDNIQYMALDTNAAPDAPVDTDATGDIAGASATVAEDLAVGSAIGLDADATDGDGDTVTYSFRDGDGNVVQTLGNFTIDAATGVVTLSSALDYETATSHVLRIYASDGTDSSYSDFTVNVTNVAPSDPVDGDSTADTLEENAVADTYTGVTAASTDVNGGTVTYALTDDAGGRFKIDATTGAILASGLVNIDYETAPLSDVNGRYYEVKATASDGTDASNETTFKIYVTNFVEHLFTPGNDVVNFNTLADGAYDFDGANYNALAGDDQVILPDLATVDAGNPWDYNVTFVAGAGNDIVQGGDGNDIVSGGEGNDWLFGGQGDDRLVGSSGNDILAGGDGSDKLTGSSGKDIFIFTDSEIGTTKLGEHDVITDFKAGEDKIDISALYDDGGTFGGLRNGKLTGQANSYYKVGYYSESGKTWLEGDTTGDGIADFVIEMSGSYKLKASDFVANSPVTTSEAAWTAAVAPLALDYETFHRDAYFI